MPVKIEEYNNVCVICPEGEFSGPDLQLAKTAVADAVDKRQLIDFVIDLEKCTFIDSEGLGTLIWIKQRAEQMFGKVKLAGLDENCRKIIEITRLSHRFEIHSDLAAALKRVA